MKKILAWALLFGLALPLGAQTTTVARATLASAFDLDGEAADDDQVVAGPDALADSTTYTLDADPDSCRLVNITVVDANSSISAGAITVAGTGCLGETKSCSFTFAAGGSGVKTLTCSDGLGAYIADVTSVTTGVLTGEAGGDTVIVGYTANSVNGWTMYGAQTNVGPNGERTVDPFGYFDVRALITTSGSSSTTVTGVSGDADAFANVSVGDLLIIQTGSTSYERKVTAKASADSITISSAITIPSTGVSYRYKKAYYSTNPAHLLAVPVHGYRTALFDWSVDANANTGGVVTSLECTQERVEFPTARWVELDTATVASGGTQANTSESINLELLPYSYCRFGVKFGTGDDADAAAEDINISVTLMK